MPGLVCSEQICCLSSPLPCSCLGHLHSSKWCHWNKWYQSCSKQKPVGTPGCYFSCLSHIIKFSISPEMYPKSFVFPLFYFLFMLLSKPPQMISPQPIVKRSELVPFSIFYVLVSDLLKIGAAFISSPLLRPFRGFLLQSEHSALGPVRLCVGQSPRLPPGPAVQPPSPFGSLNMSNSPCPRTFAPTDFSI